MNSERDFEAWNQSFFEIYGKGTLLSSVRDKMGF